MDDAQRIATLERRCAALENETWKVSGHITALLCAIQTISFHYDEALRPAFYEERLETAKANLLMKTNAEGHIEWANLGVEELAQMIRPVFALKTRKSQ